MEKNLIYNSFAAKALLTSGAQMKAFFYEGSVCPKKTGTSTSSTDIFQSDSVVDDCDLETFGLDTVPTKKCPIKESAMTTDAKHTFKSPAREQFSLSKSDNDTSLPSESDSDNSSLVIDIGSENSDAMLKSRTSARRIVTRSVKKEVESTNLLNSIMQNQEKMMQEAKKKPNKIESQNLLSSPTEDPKNYFLHTPNDNLTYNIWHLGTGGEKLKILIRSSVDAILYKVRYNEV